MVGEQLALHALTSELYILIIAQISKEEYRHYIGRSQFPRLVKDAKPHKGVPDFVSKEDLVSKVAILQNTVHKVVHVKAEPSDYNHLGKFRRYIHDDAIQLNKDCIFAGKKQLAEYLEPAEWVLLHTMLEQYRPKLTILHDEIEH